jgi:nitroreductase
MSTMTSQSDLYQIHEALTEAVATASLAPSIHNTQPWQWRIRPGALDLWADRGRQLCVGDPDARMLTISCGASLHHASIALAAHGYRTMILPYPDPSHPDHLAHLGISDQIPITPAATRLHQAIALRGTDRRPVDTQPLDENALLAITIAIQAQGCYLHPLRRDQVIELAAMVARAQDGERADDARRAELAYWVEGIGPEGTGIPDANIPARPPLTTVAQRDFGHPGTRRTDAGHDTAATYAILYGELDDRSGWLEAGQALSAGWLTATDLGVSVMPLSAVAENPATRQALRGLLSGIGYPYLVLHLGMAEGRRGPAPTPRLPAARISITEDE